MCIRDSDIYHPHTGELIASAGDELTEEICAIIEDSPIEAVEIRSVLTCESKQGVCARCYGRNLATVSYTHLDVYKRQLLHCTV